MTGKEWWDSIKDDDNKIIEWLKMQYHGETAAAMRLSILWDSLEGRTEHWAATINIIIDQEIKHAKWIAKLLKARGELPFNPGERRESYWEKEFEDPKTVRELALIGATAEKFEEEKIKVLLDYEGTPDDIREVFQEILREETFHANIFEEIAKQEK